MKIAVDVMGGDYAPDEIVKGLKQGLADFHDITKMLLVGDETVIRSQLVKHGIDESDRRLKIVHASQVVAMNEPSTAAIRGKKDSSIAVACKLMKNHEADAVVSAGHTGAAVAASVVHNRPLAGIDRPGIASVFPAPKGPFIMLDIGANVDCKPVHLAQYAILGEAYSKIVLRVAKPKVGILNIGEEDCKGNDLTLQSRDIVRQLPVQFVGNVEGKDLFANKVDVVLCDGFVGNVVLKCCESLAKAISGILKDSLKKSPVRMAGALLSKSAFEELKELTDHEGYGGAPLLGVNGVCIIAHGSSSAKSIRNAIRVAREMVQHEYNDQVMGKLSAIDWSTILNGSQRNGAKHCHELPRHEQ